MFDRINRRVPFLGLALCVLMALALPLAAPQCMALKGTPDETLQALLESCRAGQVCTKLPGIEAEVCGDPLELARLLESYASELELGAPELPPMRASPPVNLSADAGQPATPQGGSGAR